MKRGHLGLATLAWSGAAIGFALVVAAFTLPMPSGEDALFLTIFVVLMIGLSSMGALIASQRPYNAIGWLLLVAAVLFGISDAAGGYAALSIVSYDGGLPLTTLVAWTTAWTFAPGIGILAIFVPLVFPTGRLPSRAWWPIIIPAVIGPLAGAVPSAFRAGPLDVTEVGGYIQNPFGISGADSVLNLVSLVSILTAAPTLLLVIVSLILRYRRGSPTERDQIKWFAYPASVAAVALAIGLLEIGPVSEAGWVVALSAMSLVPIAIAIAILRHRLFDIDVIINRTLVYGALSVLLAAVYIGSVLLLELLLSPLTSDSGLAVAASTLGVVALFQPLRRRIQAIVDRRFFRSRYDAARIVATFMARLRDEVELDHLTDELAASISTALRPASVSVWLRGPGAD